MIRLFTGLPRQGKSLALVAELVRLKKEQPDRPVYACGIDGLKEGLAIPCLPREWEKLPEGALIVVDEAQKVWPSRGKNSATPRDIQALSEHGHFGYDFLLATQQPDYLDWYVLGLVQEHNHFVRRWGVASCDRYIWQELCPNPKSMAMRSRAQRVKWRYPKACYGLYKSATMHTVKVKRPWRVYLIPVLLLVAIALGWYGMRGGALSGLGGKTAKSLNVIQDAGGAVESRSKQKWPTVEAYVKAHIPRVANQPWSAPIFDDEAIVAKPDLLCIESEVPATPTRAAWKRCSCYTEQVTPYDLHSLEECRRYARDGVYNPRRAPVGSESQVSRGSEASSSSPSGDAPRVPRVVGGGDSWQPDWRTRRYVQPEKTTATGGPHLSSNAGAGG